MGKLLDKIANITYNYNEIAVKILVICFEYEWFLLGRGKLMKKLVILLGGLGIVALLFSGCEGPPSRSGLGTGIGAGGGALMGQALGHSTTSTLIGAGVGGLLGNVVGGGMDKQEASQQMERQQMETRQQMERQQMEIEQLRQQQLQRQQPVYGGPQPQAPVEGGQPPLQPPSGRWIEVPGQWIGGQWVPAHKTWVPTNP